MKTITIYLLKFILTAIVLTVAWRYCMSYGIDSNSSVVVALSAVGYALAMFASGWHFGRKQGEFLPIFDVGVRFHFSTYIVYHVVAELWFAFGLNSSYEQIVTIRSTEIVWGAIVVIHFMVFLWAKKTSINNLHRKDLFD
ncbi:hypothetical protein [Pedobacter deserti]|uniref:hypothetical protein n=1 Tax=Pedobacter deserti TaxID=2817382 RepID=UPI00210AB4EF|nr:hypothetical protein [Pedobacter sp. SYSU D00382]